MGAGHKHKPDICCYTDGSSLGNPGPGGWAVIMLPSGKDGGSKERILKGGSPHTTNNRMELLAAVYAVYTLLGVDVLPDRVEGNREHALLGGLFGEPTKLNLRCEKTVLISTDSEYVQKGITEYLPQWIVRHWKTVNRKPVQHRDLRQLLSAALPCFDDLRRARVRGHNGHEMNERVDKLAKNEALKRRT